MTCFLASAAVLTNHPFNNVTDNVFQKMGMNLHQRPDHPLGILKDAIYAYFDQHFPGTYNKFDDLYPVVSTRAVSRLPYSLCGLNLLTWMPDKDDFGE